MADEKPKLTGFFNNYYLANVTHPARKEHEPYIAECEDIAEALKMTPDEFCEFKAIWRTAAARLGNAKADHKALYDCEKRVHYARRSLRAERIKQGIPHDES
jgi:hypothetical protein